LTAHTWTNSHTSGTAHGAHPARRKPTTLGHVLTHSHTLRVGKDVHRRDACNRIIAGNQLPHGAERIGFGSIPLDLVLAGFARSWPERVKSCPHPVAQCLVALNQRALDGIELCQLAGAEIELTPHIDQRSDWIPPTRANTTHTGPTTDAATSHVTRTTCASPATNTAPADSALCLHRDRQHHRNSDHRGASHFVEHGRSFLHVPSVLWQWPGHPFRPFQFPVCRRSV
jgi:hypothetical protein